VGAHATSAASRPEGDGRAGLGSYQALFESNPLPVFVCDAESLHIVAANQAAVEEYGWTAAELVAMSILDIRPGDEVPALLDRLARRVVRSEVQRHRRKDGSTFEVEVVARRFEVGSRRYILGVVQDVTERRRGELALAARERHFRALVENSSDVIALIGADGLVQYLSPLGQRTLGLEVGPGAAVDGFARCHPRDLPAARRFLADCLAHPGRTFTGQMRLRRADGEWCRFEFSAVNRISDPDVGAIVANFRDVTERHSVQKALRLLERAVEGISQGIMVLKAGATPSLMYVNAGFERLTGYASADVLGRGPEVLFGPDTEPAGRQAFVEALASGSVRTIDLLTYRRDGTTFWSQTALSPVHDDAGRLTHLVVSQLDVTESRKLHEQLLQAQKMEAMGTLAGGIAHDFNNLLMVIGGYGEQLLRMLPADNPLHRKVEAIQHATERATALTRQLLTFSRREVIVPRVLDVNAVVAGVEKILRRLVGEHIDLVCLPARGLDRTLADPSQVEQVLMNLVVNARDAMPRGGALSIETANVGVPPEEAALLGLVPGPYVSLRVADTGIGMDRDTQSRIFEPFFTTKAAGKGTGLGLATVYGIVTHAGGAVKVESEPGRGSSFTVLLPRTDAVPPSSRVAAEDAPRGGHETVLVAEDDPAVRELVCTRLGAEGYTVLEARYPAEALEIALRYKGPIHLLLTDVVMPQMNGLELSRRVATTRPDTVVLYMSGYVDEFPEETGDFLSRLIPKPFSMDLLSRRVREELDRPSPRWAI
jgi:PAS domain S-box-containing protein